MTRENAEFSGTLFDGLSSRPWPATLTGGLEGWELRACPGEPEERRWTLRAEQLSLEPALASVPRALRLRAEGLGSAAYLECSAAQGAQLERCFGRPAPRFLATLERRWGGALAALVCVVAFGFAFLNAGLPLAAREAAQLTPPSTLRKLDDETVSYLRRSEVLGPSRLSAARQRQLRASFADLSREIGGPYRYRLILGRGGDLVGANAFALPAGTVVLTDELARLSRSDDELRGVLAHEITHVTQRHSLTQIYQALGLTLLAGAVTGDLIGPSTAAAAVPSLLLQSRYSRQMELAADAAAGEYLLRRVGSTQPMQRILERLERESARQHKGEPSLGWLGDWLGDHPQTQQRILALREQEQRWKAARGQP